MTGPDPTNPHSQPTSTPSRKRMDEIQIPILFTSKSSVWTAPLKDTQSHKPRSPNHCSFRPKEPNETRLDRFTIPPSPSSPNMAACPRSNLIIYAFLLSLAVEEALLKGRAVWLKSSQETLIKRLRLRLNDKAAV